jgi:hypothetical protein
MVNRELFKNPQQDGFGRMIDDGGDFIQKRTVNHRASETVTEGLGVDFMFGNRIKPV